MKRRAFIAGLGSAAAWPLVAGGQQPEKIYRIGFLANDPTIPKQLAGQAFLDGLRENGFVEGQNVVVESRFSEGKVERSATLATELVRLGGDVIVASGTEAARAAKRATNSIPIVMLNVSEPVEGGLVTSLAHPGGNVTGLSQDDSTEIATKRLQLLRDAVTRITQLAVLLHPDSRYNQRQFQQLEVAARSLNLSLKSVSVRQNDDFEHAFAAIEREHSDALFVANSGLNFVNRKIIMELAAAAKLPLISNWREATQAGGLMSYGYDRVDQFRGAAIYVSRILKGAKPADLPVEQPTKYELVVNLNTAKALNLEIPRSLLLIADEVIE